MLETLAFPRIGCHPLGLYPIVNDSVQLAQLLPLEIKLIQLRIKNTQGPDLEKQIQQSIQLASRFATKLFINDYWELAIRYGAYGVHLGQADLKNAPIHKLHQLGLKLGISAYSDAELVRACALKPSYIAYGPIFPTTSKQMTASAQGIDKLRQVREWVKDPLIAIGGISLEQLPQVLRCNVDGVAVISAINQAIDPQKAAEKLMDVIQHHYAPVS